MSTESAIHSVADCTAKSVFQRVDEAICALDANWQLTFINDDAAAMLEDTPDALLGTDIWEAVPELDETTIGTELEAAVATQEPTRLEHYSQALARWFNIRIYPDENGVTIFFYDITEERGERLTRQRQRRLFETVFEETEDALVVADTDRQITDFNRAAEQLFGYEASEVIGKATRMLYATQAAYEQQGDERFNENAPERDDTYSVEYKRADGTTFIGETLGTSLTGDTGETLGYLGSIRDVSARVEYEQELEAYNDALKTFHDISTDGEQAVDEGIEAILELGCEYLGLEIGILSAIDDTAYTVEQVVAPTAAIQAGDQFDLRETFCDVVVNSEQLFAETEIGDAGMGSHPAYRAQGLDSYIGTAVVVDGERYGTLNFSQSAARKQPFTEGERTMVRLFAQWIGKELSRRRNKQRATANRDRLRQIIDLLPQLVFAKDRDNEFILANQATADAYGTTVEAVEGSTDADFVSSATEAERFRQDDTAVMDAGEPKHIAEESLTKANGETVTLQTTKIPYDPVDHNKEAVLGVATDITDTKQRQRELEAVSQRLTVALEATSAGVWELNLETKNLVWTESIAQLFEFELSTADGTFEEFLTHVHPDDMQTVQNAIADTTEDGDTLQAEFRVQQDGGGYIWVEARAELLTGRSTPRRLVGIVTDISERKEQTAQIELQAAAMEAATDGIAILDDDEYVYMNQAHADIFGYEPAELLGREWRDLYSTAQIERIEAEAFPELKDTGSWDGEMVGQQRDGTPIHQSIGLALLDSGELICTNRDITAQKQREKELHQQRTRIRALFDSSPDSIVIHDADGAVLDVNETTVESLGYDRETLTSMNVAEFEVDADASALRLMWAEMEMNETLKAEGRHRRQNGETFPVEVWVNRVDIDGEAQFIAVGRDITERKARATELRELKERLDLAVEGANLGVWDWDMETDAVTFNEQWASMLGFSLAEIDPVLDTWEDRVHPDDMAAVEAAFEAHLAGDAELYNCEHRMRTKSGEWKWLRTVGRIVEYDEGNPTRAVGIHLDITEETESKLHLEEQRDMFAEGPAVVFKWENNEGWPVEYVSKNVAETFGYTSEQLQSGAVPYASLIHDDDIDRVMQEVSEANDASVDRFTHDPYRMVTADGEIRWVTDNTKIIRTDGEISHYLGYLIDITEQKRLERSLRESERSVRELTSIAADTDRGFEEKLTALLELGTERLDLPYGFLNRIEDGTQHVIQAVGDHPKLQTGASTTKAVSYCRKALQQSTPLTIQDAVASGWDGDPAYEHFNLGCYIGGTVTVDGEQYGTLCFADTVGRDHEFTDAERAFVELLVQWTSHELSTQTFERQLRDINETAKQLMTVPERAQIASVAIENATSLLDMPVTGVWWHDDEREALIPAEMAASTTEYVDTQPTYDKGTALAWQAFDSGELHAYNDLSVVDELHNTEQLLASAAMVPLGDHGVMCVGAVEPQAFSEAELNLLAVLSSTVEAALTRAERETVLRETQAELKRSNEELEQFAYAASHDLQEPLRTVSSYLTLLERRYRDELDADAVEFIDFAVDGVDRMRDMIQALLAYSRVDTRGTSFGTVDVGTLLQQVTDGLGVKIDEADAAVSLPATDATVTGDHSQLAQLLQNLIDNGITYNTGRPEIDIAVRREAETVCIDITDNGIGMEAGQIDDIFEVFHRLHTRQEFDGTGIGLSICRKIVDRHEGAIDVQSTPGEGSTFTITLPRGDRLDG